MGKKKISELISGTGAYASTDVMPTVESGTTKKRSNANLLGNVPTDAPFANGIPLSSGRVAFKESLSPNLTTSGWYTIAQTQAANDNAASAVFRVGNNDGHISFEVGYRETANQKNHLNTTIRILSKSTVLTTGLLSYVERVRIAKSDSVNGSGIKVQVYIDLSTALNITLIENSARNNSYTGFTLVTPFLDNTPTLPDGVTVGTFLEAGEELSFSTGLISPFEAWKSSNDAISCTAQWGQIPKQGTSITIFYPSTGFVIRDGSGNSVTVSDGTISTFFIDGEKVSFRINKVGAFSTLTSSALSVLVNGTFGKLTIT